MIKDVNSPVNTANTGSKVGSGQPKSPGAFSSPGRVGGARFDSVPPQSSRARRFQDKVRLDTWRHSSRRTCNFSPSCKQRDNELRPFAPYSGRYFPHPDLLSRHCMMPEGPLFAAFV
jgi:hypothetical protein